MKPSSLVFITLLLFQTVVKAQLHDSTLIKKLTINGFCLCQTTISGLKRPDDSLRAVAVEEMDLPKGCFGEDSRFIAEKGYYSDKNTGIIFQKDRDSDYVSKIRLTKEFKGHLPDGNFVDLNNFLLKDLFNLYPQFKDKWQSRDCSGFWKFSDDTISFYVKIDKTKQPEFPIDKPFYLDKPVVAIDLIASCRAIRMYDEGYHYGEVRPDPIFFIDSVKIAKSDLSQMNPNEVALITVIKDTITLKKFGPGAKNGIIYIETKGFDRKRYWRYFMSKSREYAKLAPTPENDSRIQYILNSKILKENFEGNLALINDKIFKGLQIITKEQLIKDYNITDKDYGVIISTSSD